MGRGGADQVGGIRVERSAVAASLAAGASAA